MPFPSLPLPGPETLSNTELLVLQTMLLEYVREIARIINERDERVAKDTGLDFPKFDTTSEMAGSEKRLPSDATRTGPGT
jgi:hypothetical protein